VWAKNILVFEKNFLFMVISKLSYLLTITNEFVVTHHSGIDRFVPADFLIGYMLRGGLAGS
jgi:hypothetical protein